MTYAAALQSPEFEALRATVEFAPLGMAHFDSRGRILLVNRRLCEMLGYSREELMRRDFLQLTFHRDVPECRAVIARLVAGEIPSFREEKRFVRADGSIVWSCVTVSAAPEVEGWAPFFIGIAEDITEKRERDAELAALADAIPQMVWTSDGLGRRSWFNNRWYEYTGLAFEDVRDLGWQRVHHPEHREAAVGGLLAALAQGSVWEDTVPLRGRDGEYRWFLSRAVPMRDESGAIVRWFGSNTDVTEQLEALRAAERARKQREEMVAAVAHDLRNPVHTIVLAAASTIVCTGLRRSCATAATISSRCLRARSAARRASSCSVTSVLLPNQRTMAPDSSRIGTARDRNQRYSPSRPRSGTVSSQTDPCASAARSPPTAASRCSGWCTRCQPRSRTSSNASPVYSYQRLLNQERRPRPSLVQTICGIASASAANSASRSRFSVMSSAMPMKNGAHPSTSGAAETVTQLHTIEPSARTKRFSSRKEGISPATRRAITARHSGTSRWKVSWRKSRRMSSSRE